MDIIRELTRILVSELNVEVPAEGMTSNDSLQDAYGLDSLGFAELVVECEDTFGITLAEDDLNVADFATLGSLAAFIEKKTAAR
ncbi:acyl carrier protein [Thermomonospora umbrina]|uniref:Acyl carrier protein n=1 Tax=Thermomonospora umbrina TaxID=111806 RepID=A0A3D9T0S4_9ACTN|nr:acyl carrier protein [Thermomonospora umbrina]REF00411.1 acyl carrier protein [Thermomonospora umbrina]